MTNLRFALAARPLHEVAVGALGAQAQSSLHVVAAAGVSVVRGEVAGHALVARLAVGVDVVRRHVHRLRGGGLADGRAPVVAGGVRGASTSCQKIRQIKCGNNRAHIQPKTARYHCNNQYVFIQKS